MIGINGAILVAVNNTKIVGEIFIQGDNAKKLENYKVFLNKFKRYKIVILLDSDVRLRHEKIPVIQSTLKINPAEQFIVQHYSNDEILAYITYEVSSSAWHTLIASSYYAGVISELTKYTIEDALRFNGLYFLSLEHKPIIEQIFKSNFGVRYDEYLQIFVYIINVSGIKFVVKYHSDLLAQKTVEYPSDKSLEYIQGIIEQNVSDYLISFKNIIQESKVKVVVLYLVNKQLEQLLISSDIKDYDLLFTSSVSQKFKDNNVFVDSLIAQKFNKQKQYIASNEFYETIVRLSLFNTNIYRIIVIIISALIIGLISVKSMILYNQSSLTLANENYYKIYNDYKLVKQKYPIIGDISNLADIYNLENSLKITQANPSEFIEQISYLFDNSTSARSIIWSLSDPISNISSSKFKALVGLTIRKDHENDEQLICRNYLENLRSLLIGNYQLKCDLYKSRIVQINNLMTVPIQITINNE